MQKPFKKYSFLILALMLILAACGGGGNSGKESNGTAAPSGGTSQGNNQQVFEIIVNDFNPSTGSIAKKLLEPWKALVEEKTQGRVKVTLFHGAALGGPMTVLKDVQGGVYDMGYLYSLYYQNTELLPLTVADLPFKDLKDIPTSTKIINELYEKYKDNMLQNVELIGITTGSPSNFFSKKPIRTVEDFKGLKIRAGGAADVASFQEWGAIPVSVALNEAYDALQKGIIDAVSVADFLGIDNHFYEVAPHYTDLPWKTIRSITIMNKDKFNQLPEDLQKLFREELFPAYNEMNEKMLMEDDVLAKEQLKELLANKGSVNQFPAEEIEKLRAITKQPEVDWIKDAAQQGFNGEQILKDFLEIQAKY